MLLIETAKLIVLLHRGESPVGVWTIIVKDTVVNEHTGDFIDWRLTFWGEAVDGSKQPLHPLPDEHDDDHPYEEAHVATTTVEPSPTKTNPPTNPDDHHDRPVNQKPSEPTTTQPATDEELGVINDPTEPSSTASPTSTAATDKNLSALPSARKSGSTRPWL